MSTTQKADEAPASALAMPDQMKEEGQLSLLRNGPLLSIGAGHGAVDLCANTLPVFYPILAVTLGLSYASVGALTTVQAIFSSLSQPLFGWLADRFGSRLIAPAAVLMAAISVALAGLVGSYYALLAVVAMVGLGVGAYHPQGAKGASVLGGKWRTTALSIYMICGTLGYSVGPLLAATVLVPAGLGSTTFLLIPGLVVATLLLSTGKRVDRASMAVAGKARALRGGPSPWLAMGAAVSVVIVRSWVEYTMVAFIPLLYASRGEPREFAGQILFVIFSTGAVGTAAGGWLADRIGRKVVAVSSFLVLLPVVHLFLGATALGAVALAFALGVILGCPATLPLVAVQEAMPTRMGMASGIAISSGMIVGGLGVSVHGLLADQVGLETSMLYLLGVLAVGLVAGLILPERQG